MAIWRRACIVVASCAQMLLTASGWGTVLDFGGLAGKPVPDDYGGLNWDDPNFGNQWVVDPNHPPQNSTPCALFEAGETPIEVTIRSATPIDFLSIEFAGRDGDTVMLFGDGPGEDHYGVDYHSDLIELNGSSVVRYEEQWLRVTSLTIYFDSLFPGSIAIDNLTFEPSPHLATIFKEDFDSFTDDQDMFDQGWEARHGQHPADDGGIWHIEPMVLDRQGVSKVYVISNSDKEGKFPSPQYMDEALISPEMDCTEFSGVRLEYRQNLRTYGGNDPQDFPEVYNLHVSNDAAHQKWESNRVPFRKEEQGDTLYPVSVDISDFADGKKIKIRWRYTANFDRWWAIDDVRVIGQAVVKINSVQVNIAISEVSIPWDAPDGFFAIEASDDAVFSDATELATGITQKQWTGADLQAWGGQRFYRVRMD